jgi:ribose 5-phosphate isomerase B
MLFIGSDHAGFKLKEEVKEILKQENVEFEDLTSEFVDGDDYPDSALKVANKVIETGERGILLCGSGIGDSIAANKVKGIRAALCYNKEEARLSKVHTDANILVLSGWFDKPEDIKDIVDAWLNAEFEGGRHKRRLDKVKQIEENFGK